MSEPDLPRVPAGASIPSHVHQTFATAQLPEQFAATVAALKATNPGWRHTLWDDEAVEDYIATHYGQDVLASYRRINPRYGAARADLFRYLLMYREGGVYLDIKSGADRPLDEVVAGCEGFLLTQWDRSPGRESFGVHRDLAGIPGGEFQQWQITAAPSHPFLAAVIERVLGRIALYSPWRDGTGGRGTYRVTGPVAYTLAIKPLLGEHSHRLTTDRSAGFVYNTTPSSHKPLFQGHYLMRTDPLVLQTGLAGAAAGAYDIAQRTRRMLFRR